MIPWGDVAGEVFEAPPPDVTKEPLWVIAKKIVGDWWYNDETACYRISAWGFGRLSFFQSLPGNKPPLTGELVPLPLQVLEKGEGSNQQWLWEASLSNGARIRFRVGDKCLISSYMRTGTQDWRPDIVAKLKSTSSAEAVARGTNRHSPPPVAPPSATTALQQWSAPRPSVGPTGRMLRPRPLVVVAEEVQHARACDLAARTRWLLVSQGSSGSLEGFHGYTSGSMGDPLGDSVAVAGLPPITPLCFAGTPPLLVKCMQSEAVEEARSTRANAHEHRSNAIGKVGAELRTPLSINEDQMLRTWMADPRGLGYNIADGRPAVGSKDAKDCSGLFGLMMERHDVLAAHSACTLGVCGCRFTSMLAKGDAPLLGVNLHHILGDADTLGVLWNEVFAIDLALANGYTWEAIKAILPPLPVQYVDFAYWQTTMNARGLLEADVAFWLSGIVASTPPVVLDLPLDMLEVGASQRGKLSHDVLAAVQETVPAATPFGVVIALWTTVLSRYSSDSFINMATPFGLRPQAELQHLIGDFVNMVVIPAKVNNDAEPFVTTMARLTKAAVNVHKFSQAPFLNLVTKLRRHYPTRDPSRPDIYASMVDLVPNDSDGDNQSMLGILDIFLLANTKQGQVWSADAVWNTSILDGGSARYMLLQMQTLAVRAARLPNVPLPNIVEVREEGQPPPEGATGVVVAHLRSRAETRGRVLPKLLPVISGWPVQDATADAHALRHAWRLRRHSGLQLASPDLAAGAWTGGVPSSAAGPPSGLLSSKAEESAALAEGAKAQLTASAEAGPQQALPWRKPVAVVRDGGKRDIVKATDEKAIKPVTAKPVTAKPAEDSERMKKRRAEVALRCARVAERETAIHRQAPVERSRLIRF
eukprot:CAMPEP_0115167252 /NCGR_PEP_ID=MMETSP0270-20121206/116_1 /TAXON_ID=71861 /ORGANISM="Scrippsiella trochoidea, Strain CCMP3099" /LENGTH=872 /DNA_ID=CAMNT_0002579831 /DNA_START=130 /DNA_END=2751 /DNA_ORIENTATION=-